MEIEMGVIFIQTVFDAERIWAKYKGRLNFRNSSSNPCQIDHEDMFMITSPKYLQDHKTQATWDLSIRAKMTDRVRWSGITISDETEYAVIIYNVILNPNAPAGNKQVTSDPTPLLAYPYVPIPQKVGTKVDPLDCKFVQTPEYYLGADIVDYGVESYAVQFFITQGEETLAYFQWDPSITVSPW
ncbi:hypothetical protein DIE19_14145 [Burkholderia sp. Bp9126]|nr:hypothetical protein DIE19_14145 [Burkholderia sp. Bp9126]